MVQLEVDNMMKTQKSFLLAAILFVLCAFLLSSCSLPDVGQIVSQSIEEFLSGIMASLSGIGNSMREMFEGFSIY